MRAGGTVEATGNGAVGGMGGVGGGAGRRRGLLGTRIKEVAGGVQSGELTSRSPECLACAALACRSVQPSSSGRCRKRGRTWLGRSMHDTCWGEGAHAVAVLEVKLRGRRRSRVQEWTEWVPSRRAGPQGAGGTKGTHCTPPEV